MAEVALGRKSPDYPWEVAIAFPGIVHTLNLDEVQKLLCDLQEKVLIVQERNRDFKPRMEVVNGEGSYLRDDAKTKRHLSAVK